MARKLFIVSSLLLFALTGYASASVLLKCEGTEMVRVKKVIAHQPGQTCKEDAPICFREFTDFWVIDGDKAYSETYLYENVFKLFRSSADKKYGSVFFSIPWGVEDASFLLSINPSTGEYYVTDEKHFTGGSGNKVEKRGFCEKMEPKELFEYPPQ